MKGSGMYVINLVILDLSAGSGIKIPVQLHSWMIELELKQVVEM